METIFTKPGYITGLTDPAAPEKPNTEDRTWWEFAKDTAIDLAAPVLSTARVGTQALRASENAAAPQAELDQGTFADLDRLVGKGQAALKSGRSPRAQALDTSSPFPTGNERSFTYEPLASSFHTIVPSIPFMVGAALTGGTALGAAAGAGVAGLQGLGENLQELQDFADTTPLEQLKELEPFKKLLVRYGGDERAARWELFRQSVDWKAAVASFAANSAEFGVFLRGLGPGVSRGLKQRLVSALKGGVEGAVSGGAEGLTDAYLSEKAKVDTGQAEEIDPREIASQTAKGTIMGAPMAVWHGVGPQAWNADIAATAKKQLNQQQAIYQGQGLPAPPVAATAPAGPTAPPSGAPAGAPPVAPGAPAGAPPAQSPGMLPGDFTPEPRPMDWPGGEAPVGGPGGMPGEEEAAAPAAAAAPSGVETVLTPHGPATVIRRTARGAEVRLDDGSEWYISNKNLALFAADAQRAAAAAVPPAAAGVPAGTAAPVVTTPSAPTPRGPAIGERGIQSIFAPGEEGVSFETTTPAAVGPGTAGPTPQRPATPEFLRRLRELVQTPGISDTERQFYEREIERVQGELGLPSGPQRTFGDVLPDMRAIMVGVNPDTRKLAALAMRNRLLRTGRLTGADMPAALTANMTADDLAILRAAIEADPQAALNLIEQTPRGTSEEDYAAFQKRYPGRVPTAEAKQPRQPIFGREAPLPFGQRTEEGLVGYTAREPMEGRREGTSYFRSRVGPGVYEPILAQRAAARAAERAKVLPPIEAAVRRTAQQERRALALKRRAIARGTKGQQLIKRRQVEREQQLRADIDQYQQQEEATPAQWMALRRRIMAAGGQSELFDRLGPNPAVELRAKRVPPRTVMTKGTAKYVSGAPQAVAPPSPVLTREGEPETPTAEEDAFSSALAKWRERANRLTTVLGEQARSIPETILTKLMYPQRTLAEKQAARRAHARGEQVLRPMPESSETDMNAIYNSVTQVVEELNSYDASAERRELNAERTRLQGLLAAINAQRRSAGLDTFPDAIIPKVPGKASRETVFNGIVDGMKKFADMSAADILANPSTQAAYNTLLAINDARRRAKQKILPIPVWLHDVYGIDSLNYKSGKQIQMDFIQRRQKRAQEAAAKAAAANQKAPPVGRAPGVPLHHTFLDLGIRQDIRRRLLWNQMDPTEKQRLIDKYAKDMTPLTEARRNTLSQKISERVEDLHVEALERVARGEPFLLPGMNLPTRTEAIERMNSDLKDKVNDARVQGTRDSQYDAREKSIEVSIWESVKRRFGGAEKLMNFLHGEPLSEAAVEARAAGRGTRETTERMLGKRNPKKMGLLELAKLPRPKPPIARGQRASEYDVTVKGTGRSGRGKVQIKGRQRGRFTENRQGITPQQRNKYQEDLDQWMESRKELLSKARRLNKFLEDAIDKVNKDLIQTRNSITRGKGSIGSGWQLPKGRINVNTRRKDFTAGANTPQFDHYNVGNDLQRVQDDLRVTFEELDQFKAGEDYDRAVMRMLSERSRLGETLTNFGVLMEQYALGQLEAIREDRAARSTETTAKYEEAAVAKAAAAAAQALEGEAKVQDVADLVNTEVRKGGWMTIENQMVNKIDKLRHEQDVARADAYQAQPGQNINPQAEAEAAQEAARRTGPYTEEGWEMIDRRERERQRIAKERRIDPADVPESDLPKMPGPAQRRSMAMNADGTPTLTLQRGENPAWDAKIDEEWKALNSEAAPVGAMISEPETSAQSLQRLAVLIEKGEATNVPQRYVTPQFLQALGEINTGTQVFHAPYAVVARQGLDDPAYYWGSHDRIVLSRDLSAEAYATSVLHENVHAATEWLLRNDAKFRAGVQSLLDSARASARRAGIDLNKLPRDYYGLTSPSEYITETTSNQQFREFLNRVRTEHPPITGIKSALHALYRMIRDAFRRVMGAFNADTALDILYYDQSSVLGETDRMLKRTFDKLRQQGRPANFGPQPRVSAPRERIERAAIRVGKEVFTGQTHSDALDRANSRLQLSDADFVRGLEGETDGKFEEGFTTSEGRFVSREEAAQIDAASDRRSLSLKGSSAFLADMGDNIKMGIGTMAERAKYALETKDKNRGRAMSWHSMFDMTQRGSPEFKALSGKLFEYIQKVFATRAHMIRDEDMPKLAQVADFMKKLPKQTRTRVAEFLVGESYHTAYADAPLIEKETYIDKQGKQRERRIGKNRHISETGLADEQTRQQHQYYMDEHAELAKIDGFSHIRDLLHKWGAEREAQIREARVRAIVTHSGQVPEGLSNAEHMRVVKSLEQVVEHLNGKRELKDVDLAPLVDHDIDIDDPRTRNALKEIGEIPDINRLPGPYIPFVRRGPMAMTAQFKLPVPTGAFNIDDHEVDAAGRLPGEQRIVFQNEAQAAAHIREMTEKFGISQTAGGHMYVDISTHSIPMITNLDMTKRRATEAEIDAMVAQAGSPIERRPYVTYQTKGFWAHENEMEAEKNRRILQEMHGDDVMVSQVMDVYKHDARQNQLYTSQQLQKQINRMRASPSYQWLLENNPQEATAIMDSLNMAAEEFASRRGVKQRYLPRGFVKGASTDIVNNFKDYAAMTAGYIAKLRYQSEIDRYSKEMKNYITGRSYEAGENSTLLHQRIYDAMMRELHAPAKNPRETGLDKWIDRLLKWTMLDKLPHVQYFAQNATEPGVVLAPLLAGDHDYNKVLATMGGMYAMAGKSRYIDDPINGRIKLPSFGKSGWNDFKAAMKGQILKEIPDPNNPGQTIKVPVHTDYRKVNRERVTGETDQDGLIKLYDEASARGVLDASASLEYDRAFLTSPALIDRVSDYLTGMFMAANTAVENLNRFVSLGTAYRLQMAKLTEQGVAYNEAHNQALEYAIEMTHKAAGQYANFNKPERFKSGPLAKLFFQFKMYPQRIIANYIRATVNMFSSDPVLRKQGRRQLFFAIATQAVVAGLLGMPFDEPFRLALDAAFVAGASPYNYDHAVAGFRRWAAQNFGKDVGEILAHGPLRYITGIDTQALSQSSLATFGTPRSNKTQDLQAGLFGVFAGAGGSTLFDLLRGTQKGFEAVRHLSNGADDLAWKAARESAEKLVLFRQVSDLITAANDMNPELNRSQSGRRQAEPLSPVEAAAQAGGFTPRRIAERREEARAVNLQGQALKSQRKELIDTWVQSPSSRATVQRHIDEFNRSVGTGARITRDDLLRAQQTRRKAERQPTSDLGLALDRQTRTLLPAAAATYNTR